MCLSFLHSQKAPFCSPFLCARAHVQMAAAAKSEDTNVQVTFRHGILHGDAGEKASVGPGALNCTIDLVKRAVSTPEENDKLIKSGAIAVCGVPSGAVISIKRLVELAYDRDGENTTPVEQKDIQFVNGVERNMNGPPVMDHAGCVVGRNAKHFHGDADMLLVVMAVRKARGITDGFGFNGKFYM